MRFIGWLLYVLFFLIGAYTEKLSALFGNHVIIATAFVVFTLAILFLILSENMPKCKLKDYYYPPPPLISKESLRLTNENDSKAKEVINELKKRVHEKPDFPNDRISS